MSRAHVSAGCTPARRYGCPLCRGAIHVSAPIEGSPFTTTDYEQTNTAVPMLHRKRCPSPTFSRRFVVGMMPGHEQGSSSAQTRR